MQEIERQLKKVEQEKFGAEKSLIQLAVVGAGYSGVELAATLAERLGDRGKVQVVDGTPDICSSAPVGNREAAYKASLFTKLHLPPLMQFPLNN